MLNYVKLIAVSMLLRIVFGGRRNLDHTLMIMMLESTQPGYCIHIPCINTQPDLYLENHFAYHS